MHLPECSVPVLVSAVPVEAVDTDLLIVPCFEDALAAGLGSWPEPIAGPLAAATASHEFTAKPYSLFHLRTDRWRAPRLVFVGMGLLQDFSLERLRRAATTGALDARTRRSTRVGFVMPLVDAAHREAQVSAEGLLLAAWHPASHKTEERARPATSREFLLCATDAAKLHSNDVQAAADRGRLLGECSNLARALANEPANVVTPSSFVAAVRMRAEQAGLDVETVDEDRLAELGMNLVLAVGRGSAERPRLLQMRYTPEHAETDAVLGLVGKGVTFDAGGISLKSSDGMFKMKSDMSGGAAVVAAMVAIAGLKPRVRVIGVVPLVENMPGGRAMRPGDVVRSADGKTIEVLDTDAEGRLILADALWYARQQGATHLVDIATLTGAINVALGRHAVGLFAAPDAFADVVRRTANQAGDRVWQLPLFDEYRDQLRSEIADFTNIGGRSGGSITAAMLLKEFTGGLPWAHLDVAATAWAEEAQPYQPKGPTGIGVRTLATLPETFAEWPTAKG